MSVRSGVAQFVVSAVLAAWAAASGAAEDGKQPEPAVLEQIYLGKHRLRVNRIPGPEWAGSVTISHQNGALMLTGGLASGPHHLELTGMVVPVSSRKFHLDGELRGVPDMAWAGEPLRDRLTQGRFTFEATGQRRYWRMYQVNGRDCVCGESCGNDFCYIDIEFGKPPRAR
jgi:hypothetical protein